MGVQSGPTAMICIVNGQHLGKQWAGTAQYVWLIGGCRQGGCGQRWDSAVATDSGEEFIGQRWDSVVATDSVEEFRSQGRDSVVTAETVDELSS